MTTNYERIKNMNSPKEMALFIIENYHKYPIFSCQIGLIGEIIEWLQQEAQE